MIHIPIIANSNIQQIMQNATQSVQQAGQKMSQSMQSASSKISQSMNQAGQKIQGAFQGASGQVGNFSSQITSQLKAIPPQAMVAVAGITAVGVAVTKLGTDYVQTAKNIKEFSSATSTTAEEYQKFKSLFGGDEGAVVGVISNISTTMKDAIDPATDMAKAYKTLGVAITNSDGSFRTNSQILGDTLKGLSKVTDASERARLGYLLMSTDYSKVAMVLEDGADAYEKYNAQAEKSIVMNERQVKLGTEIAKQFSVLSTAVKSVTFEALDPLMTTLNSVFSLFQSGNSVFSQQFEMIKGSLTSLGKTFAETFDTLANSTLFSAMVANINIVIIAVDKLMWVFNKLFETAELSLTGITLILNGTIKKIGDFLVMMESLQAKATKILGTGENNPVFKAFFEGLRDSGAKDFERDLERIAILKEKLSGKWKAPELPSVVTQKGGTTPTKTGGTTPTTDKTAIAENIIPVNEIKTASVMAEATISEFAKFIEYKFAPQNFSIWQAFQNVQPMKTGLALVTKEISATQEKNLAISQANYEAQQKALDDNYVNMFISDEQYLKSTQDLRASYEIEKKDIILAGTEVEKQAYQSASEAFSQSIENRKQALTGLLSATQTVWGAITTTASAFGGYQDTLHQNEMTRLQAESDKRMEIMQEQMGLTVMSSRARVLAEKRIADAQKKNEADAETRAKAYNEKKKGWAITQATIDGALSIANIWKDWASNPIMAGILTALATATTATQIATISAQQYANGGVIGGMTGASYGKDNTVISARKGEMVINAPQQRELWAVVNGRSSRGSSVTLSPVITYNVSGDVSKDTMKRLKQNENESLANLEASIKTLKRYGRI